jgi:hypothetical protein
MPSARMRAAIPNYVKLGISSGSSMITFRAIAISATSYAFHSVSMSSTPIGTRRKYPELSNKPLDSNQEPQRLHDLLTDQYTQVNRRKYYYDDEHCSERQDCELLDFRQYSFQDHRALRSILDAISLLDRSAGTLAGVVSGPTIPIDDVVRYRLPKVQLSPELVP